MTKNRIYRYLYRWIQISIIFGLLTVLFGFGFKGHEGIAASPPVSEWILRFVNNGSADSSVDSLAVGLGGEIYALCIPGSIVRKYDPSGNLLWSQGLEAGVEASARGIAVSNLGEVYICGVITSGSFAGQSRYGWPDAFIRKYDSSGTHLWTRQYGTDSGAQARCIAVSSTGYVYAAGMNYGVFPGQSSSGSDDACVAKYDGSGNQIWIHQFGSPSNDHVEAITCGLNGEIYVSGQIYMNAALPGQTSAGGNDAFVSKLNSDGNVLWNRQFGTASFDVGSGIAVGSQGEIYDAGVAGGALSGQNCVGSDGAFLRRYDSNGNDLWTRQFGGIGYGARSYSVATWSQGQVFVAGYTQGTIPGQVSAGSQDAFVSKYGSDGTEQWTLQFGSSNSDYARCIAGGPHGEVYVGGNARGQIPNQTSTVGNGAFLLKFAAPKAPEMMIEGNSIEIVCGDTTPNINDYTDFGNVALIGSISERTYIIKNTGNAQLNLSNNPNITLIGLNAADFSVVFQPSSTISSVSQTSFTVRFDPSDLGLRSANVSIANNDSDENPYTFAIQGIGILNAKVIIDPVTLNLKSKGNALSAYIELPQGYIPEKIDISSIKLNGIVPALSKPISIGDSDKDGVFDLMVKFDRASVQSILSDGDNVKIKITGTWNIFQFEGSDFIKVIK